MNGIIHTVGFVLVCVVFFSIAHFGYDRPQPVAATSDFVDAEYTVVDM